VDGTSLTRRAVRAGSMAGVGIVYLALVGMIQAFSGTNLIGDVATLARLLILLPPFVGAYVLVQPQVRSGEAVTVAPEKALTAGAMCGLIAGGLTAIGIALVEILPEDAVRNIFVSVTTQLIQIMTFGRSTAQGVAILLVLATVSGALGGTLGALSVRFRRPIVIGVAVVSLLGMLQDVFRVALIQLGFPTAWLFSARFGGLTYLGAGVAFAVGAAGTTIWADRLRVARSEREEEPAPDSRGVGKRPTQLLAAVGIFALLAVLPVLLGTFLSSVLGRVGLFLLMGLGLNIVVGYAGLLDLGYVAFFAVGAYTTGVLTAAPDSGSSIHVGLGFFEAAPIVIVIAVITGVIIGGPVLRLRGDYLAIVTLGFGEIARVLVTSDWLKPFLGGAQGLIGIPAPSILGFSLRDPQPFYYLALAFCAVAAFISWRLATSRVGRAWTAMREDEQVAEAMGVSTVKYKLLAFACGAGIGSLSGALFAVQIGSLAPSSFSILISIQALAIIILGGMGSIPGVIVGGLVLIGLPGFLSEFQEFQLLIYGAVLVAIMLLRPQGLVPNVRRMRELREDEEAQDQWAKDLDGDTARAFNAGSLGRPPV
jgi:branched-chain amino acid transport system permease protein